MASDKDFDCETLDNVMVENLRDRDTEPPRNPSPPPNVESLLPDKIGTTTFSKRGVLSTLMHIASLVHERSISRQSNNSSNENSRRSVDGVRSGSELVTEARTPNQAAKSQAPGTLSESTSNQFSSLTLKAVSFSASNLNFSPLKTSKQSFSPTRDDTPERESQSRPSSSHRGALALSTIAGVTFSPIDISSFAVFSRFKATPRRTPPRNGCEQKEAAADANGVAKCTSVTERSGDGNDKDPGSRDYPEEEFLFSESLEQEYCELVDMTIEKDVVLYLREENLDDLLQYILFATDFPRIQELTLSIYANSCCVEEVCDVTASNDSVIEMVLVLVHVSSDADVLTEAFRLLVNILSMSANRNDHIVSKLLSFDINAVVTFILDNCLNDFLLRQITDLLNCLVPDFENEIQDWLTGPWILKFINLCDRKISEVRLHGEKLDLKSADPCTRIIVNTITLFHKLTQSYSAIFSVIENYNEIIGLVELISSSFSELLQLFFHENSDFLRSLVGLAFAIIFSQEESTQSSLLLSSNHLCKLIRTCCLETCDDSSCAKYSFVSMRKNCLQFVNESLALANSRVDLLDNFTVFNGVPVTINEYPPPN